MTLLETDRLLIRNWEDRDGDIAHEINSDDTVMKYFPFRRSRSEANAFLARLREGIDREGFGFCALELKATGEAIGFAGIKRTDIVPTLRSDTMEIGWRLATRYWGKGYATEASREWLRHGFEQLDLDRIASFAVHDNQRSTAVMERLSMRRTPEHDFDHAGIPDTHAALRPHVVYLLDRADWLRDNGRG